MPGVDLLNYKSATEWIIKTLKDIVIECTYLLKCVLIFSVFVEICYWNNCWNWTVYLILYFILLIVGYFKNNFLAIKMCKLKKSCLKYVACSSSYTNLWINTVKENKKTCERLLMIWSVHIWYLYQNLKKILSPKGKATVEKTYWIVWFDH